jgi:NodT family efflux transporter outer membrane factor (OMF) lipoprotein
MALALTGCAVGEDYLRPLLAVPAAYKETKVVRTKGWKTATPAETLARGPWWTLFRDPALNRLGPQVAASNQSLKAAEAAWRQALAVVREAEAGYFPTVGFSGNVTRSGAHSATTGRYSAGSSFRDTFALSWEPDFWGRVRRQVEANTANAAASEADLANARLSAEGTLAVAYFQLRGADERRRLLNETVDAYRRSATIVRNQREAGVASEADLAQAETQLRSAEASAISTGQARAQYEHAIAVLTGRAPAEVAVAATERRVNLPRIPAGVPSELLERRPDIAAAERDIMAANARIGVAETAWFPTISLAASGGTASTSLGGLFKASNSFWSLGPAAVAQTLIDFGARQAQVDQTRAAYDGTVASYRQTVLTAFQAVEDQLSNLSVLARQVTAQAEVVDLAKRAVELTLNQYRAGTVAYSSVITAQATSLNAQEQLISLRTQQFVATVDLIVALGGGWSTADLTTPARTAAR